MESSLITPDYVTRHLLSIGGFAPEVLAALASGLPLAVCRLVNGLQNAADRLAALEPLHAAGVGVQARTSPLLPRGVSKRVERAARRLRSQQGATRTPSQVATGPLSDGWLEPDELPERAIAIGGVTWIYPVQSSAAKLAESLPHAVVEALLARYLHPGDQLVDVTAGTGTIGTIAKRLGIASWSCDLLPGADFVHEVDARELATFLGAPRPSSSDGLVVHPPTYAAWLDSLDREAKRLATIDEYSEEVAAMLAGSIGVLVPGGVAIVITRPVRAEGQAWLATSHLSQVIVEFGMRLIGYHVAVAEDGSEDWHVLVGEVPGGLN